MIITLYNSYITAKINSLGAQLISLQDNNHTEYIWQQDQEIWDKSSPILFPIIGNCRNNQTKINHRFYTIPKHGFCIHSDFSIESQSDTSVTFTLNDNEYTYSMYPYHFKLSITYTLEKQSIIFKISVKNCDNDNIYYCLGLHPGIRCPIFENEAFSDYQIVFSHPEIHGYRHYNQNTLEFDMSKSYYLENTKKISLSHSLFLQDAIWFDRLLSKNIRLINPLTSKGIQVDFYDFHTLALWKKPMETASFLCIEPWNGSAICSNEDDEFLHKNNIQTLEKGGTKEYKIQLSILT